MARVNTEVDSFYVKFKTLMFLISAHAGQETVLQDSVAVRDGQLIMLWKHVQPECLLRILFALK